MAEFDQYGEGDYERAVNRAISISGRDATFYGEHKARLLTDVARRKLGSPDSLSVLDVGAGTGLVDVHLSGTFDRVVGLDVAEEMLKLAGRRNPDVEYVSYDGDEIPFANGSFDLVFASCVFHHVQPDARAVLIDEMARVTRPGGLVALIEHNPLNPLTRYGVSRCEFDESELLLRMGETRRLLAAGGLRETERRYIVFFPFHNRLERRLGWLPLGAKYYVASSR